MTRAKFAPRAAAIPSSRLSRLARFGGLASSLAAGMAAEGIGRAARGERPRLDAMLLTPGNARRVADKLAGMRGAAMKAGQLLSMEAGDVLPSEISDILGRLRSEADFMPPRQLKSVLIANWGADFLSRFERFDVTPIAAASIGQVHRARTKDGRDLAIKVQYPGVRRSIDSDMANVGALIRMSGLAPRGVDLAPLLEEARRQLHDETDYAREGRCLAQFQALLADAPDFVVPTLQEDLSTPDILAMSFHPGEPIESLADAPQAERDRVMALLVELLFRETFEFRLMQTDPNFANYRYDPATGRLILLDFGATRSFDPALTEVYREFLRICLSGDREALRRGSIALGYLREETPAPMREALLDMAEIAAAALRRTGPFDFAGSGLAEQLRDAAEALGTGRELDQVPPVDTLFAQRKAAGLFMLGARLRARVDVQTLLSPYL